jgi:flagellar FliL protein
MAEDSKGEKDDGAASEGKAAKSPMMKYILIGVGVVAVLGINAGLTMLVVGGKHDAPPAQQAAESAAEPSAHGADAGHGGEGGGGGDGEHVPHYYAFDPPFVVNFQAQDTIRFLQIKVEVMTKDAKVVEAVEKHMPVIRNNLIVLFSSQDFTTVSTRVGKERLRAQTLAEIQKVLKENTGQPGVEAVYFTSFVMQ